MKNIIIFGATGGTGKYLLEYLYEHLDLNENHIIASGRRKEFNDSRFEYISVDITNKEDFDKLPNDVYAVVDLAGMMPARMEGYDPYLYIDTNIIGTLNVLEYCKRAKADRILFAQSFGDIKDHAESNPFLKVDLDRKFSFVSDHTIYVMSKNFAVDMIENYHQLYNIKNFIFRLPTIYLYEKNDEYYVDGKKRKIGYRTLIEKAIKGETIEVWGDPTRKKDMVYVKDFCQMLYLALFVDRNSGYYNVGTGKGTSLLEQIQGFVEVFGRKDKKSNIIFCPDKPNAPQYIMDIESARKELGYSPKYSYIDWLNDFKIEMEEDLNK